MFLIVFGAELVAKCIQMRHLIGRVVGARCCADSSMRSLESLHELAINPMVSGATACHSDKATTNHKDVRSCVIVARELTEVANFDFRPPGLQRSKFLGADVLQFHVQGAICAARTATHKKIDI